MPQAGPRPLPGISLGLARLKRVMGNPEVSPTPIWQAISCQRIGRPLSANSRAKASDFHESISSETRDLVIAQGPLSNRIRRTRNYLSCGRPCPVGYL